MKKVISTLALGAVLATVASADFARVEMGAGAWTQAPTGTITYTDPSISATGTYTSDENVDTSGYVWLLIKHPIPIVPNVRLEYANMKDTGTVSGTFEDFTASGSDASLELTQYDIIPYYNILDNTFWVTVDLGLDIKVQTSDFVAKNVTIAGNPVPEYTDTTTIAIPMLYLRGRAQIPTTDIGVEADVKYISYDGSTIYDMRAKLDYTFDITPIIQPGIEVGYRVQKFDVSTDDDKTKMDMTFAGLYVGAMLRF